MVCQRNDGGCVLRIGLKVSQKVILLIDTETNTVAPGFYVYGLCAASVYELANVGQRV